MTIHPANTAPDLSTPLISEPPQMSPGVPTADLGPLAHLIGTWTNQNLAGTDKGGPGAPYSYNVMPLPQVDPSTPDGFILKNFSYYEELTFSAIHGSAANRGGVGTQTAFTAFYEQRVYFAEGPNKDALVHAENGSLLFLKDGTQQLGPYGNGDLPGICDKTVHNSMPPTQDYDIVKQVSVPHGNSILALGNYVSGATGVPSIPQASVIPQGYSGLPPEYTTQNPVTNPQPQYTANPNQVLTDALAARAPTNYLELELSSTNGTGAVTNIGFEQQHANVESYGCTYWLESFDGTENYTQLQYSQNILMKLPIGGRLLLFPHVTANTLTKVPGS
ncbi:heme-binding protein [Kordiimonas lipolytica]|uniref:Heme-binding protein n=1 Tax=Kordiimonas lipolytica TaxID=1662421 RepID=A0ABV8UD05_9PROT|nr:heme-binding protein [Kordiimonas lipolytica]